MSITNAGGGVTTTFFGVPESEYQHRLATVRSGLTSRGVDAIVLFNSPRIEYLTGFTHVSTERPMALVVPADGEPGVLIPHLEQEHVNKSPFIKHVQVYPEYPAGASGRHPMEHLADLINDRMGLLNSRIAADRDGYTDINGYVGPALSAALGADVQKAPEVIDTPRQVKSEVEIELIRQSCIWGNYAHRLLQDYMAVGRTEIETSLVATTDATRAMLKTLGRAYSSHGRGVRNVPVSASFIAGRNTALPHGLRSEVGLMPGDAIVTGASANVGGYKSELERTMVVGEPSDDFRKHFDVMLQIQDAAFEAFRPGRSCAEVEADVVKAFEAAGMRDYQRHHTGHGIGVEGHEQPFCDLGDDTEVRPGMIFSVEPGVYIPGIAGFRHSDTILITDKGCELLTFYPRDLDSLIVPA